MSMPTLSFLYQLGNASTSSGNWFKVQVSDSVTTTTLFSPTTDAGYWTHRWFDLSPWVSRTITLTFNLHQTAGQPGAWADLDEITIGSAYPDLWVSKSGKETAIPGEQVIYTLAYGNRGGAAASGVRITDTLPAELIFASASLTPAITTPVLAWEVGNLAATSGPVTIAVTVTVAPTATLLSNITNTVSIGLAAPELEKANNVAQAATFVGYRIYLPIVMKNYFD